MKLNKFEVLVLKKIKKDYTSANNFKYPKSGIVEAPDWNGDNVCGGGLHGIEWGIGSFDIEEYGPIFVVIKVNKKHGYVVLDDKVKFKKGKVILTTRSSKKVIELIKKHLPKRLKKEKLNYDIGGDQIVDQGYRSTANQGDSSTANQGDRSTANQGYSSTANQGDRSTATIYGDEFIYRNRNSLSAIIMFFGGDMKIFQQGKDYDTDETVKIFGGRIVKKYKSTPNNIKTLKDWEVFVFGSNRNGNHAGGAAKLASDKFGAEDGMGEGLSGQSYAFPTLDEKMQPESDEHIRESIQKLISEACYYTTYIFLVTKVGCGIAGFDEDKMKSLWQEFYYKIPANIVLPEGWYQEE